MDNDVIADCNFEDEMAETAHKDNDLTVEPDKEGSTGLRGVLTEDDEIYARNYWENKPNMQKRFPTLNAWLLHVENQQKPGSRR